jgi:hypothetical protein
VIRVGSDRRPAVGADAVADHPPAASTRAFRAALRAAATRDDAAADAAAQAAQRPPTPPNPVPPGPTATATPATRSSELAARHQDDPMSPTSTEPGAATATAALSSPGGTAASGATAHTATPPIRTGAGTGPPPAGPPAGSLEATLASLGLGAVAPPTQGTQVAAITPAPSEAAPISAMLAAAGRAVGSLVALGAARPDASAPVAAPPVTAMPAGLEAVLTMTPLEQAVHDLLGRVAEHETGHARAAKPASDDASDPALAPFHLLAQTHIASVAHDPGAPATGAPARAAAPVQIPEPPANPSHVHLVLDDGPERTVVTVALRGTEVHVALRSTDDATTTALARNAASLDHAMRARGLALAELTAEREPPDRHPPRDPEPRERREPAAEPFQLEETP